MIDSDTVLGRRQAMRLMAGVGLLGLGGCATGLARPGGRLPFYDTIPPLAPIRPHPDRLFKITVCLRPFRAQGPRFDAEPLGDKLVVHNYGHGGSGWSLSWGSAELAVGKAMAGGVRDIAVIGCGAIGLTTALVAQRAGARVTIYAKELLPQARSSRATGTWSPDSRIALARAASPEFPALWEALCRTSFRQFQTFLGLPGAPVEWTDRYSLSDVSPDEARRLRAELHKEGDPEFVQYGSRVRDLTPRSMPAPAGAHPFPTPFVTRTSSMQFNIAEYGRLLMADFLTTGGKIEPRTFASPSELAGLPQKVIINCTGYGARALWKDESITPVRGQIGWLIPQPEVNYGLYYKNVSMLSRRDGIVIQQSGASEAWGFNDDNEQPDRAEAEAALAVYADLYARMDTSLKRAA